MSNILINIGVYSLFCGLVYTIKKAYDNFYYKR